MRPTRSYVQAAVVAAGVAAAVATAAFHGAARATALARVDPGRFAGRITNPYLPYRVGSTWVYRGVKDGVTQTSSGCCAAPD